MKWVFAVAGTLLGLIAIRGDDWELVYPEGYEALPNVEMLSIGESPEEVLIGCRDGTVLRAEKNQDGTLKPWEKIKLQLIYDIAALYWLGDRWIIGSPIDFGNYAIQIPPENDPGGRAGLEASKWDLKYVHFDDGGNGSVTRVLAAADSIIAAGVLNIACSIDGGEEWEVLTRFRRYEDIEVFDGRYFLLMKRYAGGRAFLDLYASSDGIDWSIVQTVSSDESEVASDLSVLSKVYDTDGFPILEESRLFMSGSFSENGTVNNFQVSMGKDSVWHDHGSYRMQHEGPYERPTDGSWNPLQLPDTQRNFPRYEVRLDPVVYNLSIQGNFLERNTADGWMPVFRTRPFSSFSEQKTCQWGGLATIYNQDKLLFINKDGALSEYPLPTDVVNWEQLISIGGTFYLLSSSPSQLFKTRNLMDWEEMPVSGYSVSLIEQDSRLVEYYSVMVPETPIDWRNPQWTPEQRKAVWDNEEWITYPFTESLGNRDFHPFRTGVYFPHSKKWYYLSSGESIHEFIEPDVSDPDATHTRNFIASLKLETWWGPDYHLSSPDNERLFAFGGSAEFAIVDLDGTVEYHHPWQFFTTNEFWIKNIKWINGWYYILGSTTLRTRDFIKYEALATPNNEPLTDIGASGGFLYAFVQGAVFRIPEETGFLESLEPKPGWHHADWLGWFQIVDEELGDIDHLLLGKCWVKQTSELEYWIRTEALDWIYVHKDWSPWFWRMEDGHWYWLDHDSWPGRAWDKDDQEWEELAW